MTQKRLTRIITLVSASTAIGLSVSCAPERTASRDVITTGDDWVKRESVQKHRDPCGHTTYEKQKFYEKSKCVDKKGRNISVSNRDECIKKGGKIIDEVVIEEQTKN